MVSRPGPPQDSGTSMPQQPSAPSFWIAARGKCSVRSQSLTCGRTSEFMNWRTVSRIRDWWSEKEKSMFKVQSLTVQEFNGSGVQELGSCFDSYMSRKYVGRITDMGLCLMDGA